MSVDSDKLETLSHAYRQAYERALLADGAYKAAIQERADALDALDAAEAKLDRWNDDLTASLRIAVKDRHPEIDPTKVIERT